MKLTYSWTEIDGAPSPQCVSDAVEVDGVSPLACLLSDDGGQQYQATLPWLDTGMECIARARDQSTETLNWSRDAWAADLSRGVARVYSLYDESFGFEMSLEAFERALKTWREFLAIGPNSSGRPVTVSIDI